MINVTINGQQGSRYGLTLDETALAVLMTPPPKKEDIRNESRLEHGVRVISNREYVKSAERKLLLKCSISAPSREEFFRRFNLFCSEVLDGGEVDIQTSYQEGVVYRCRYKDCQQLTYYNGRLANFALNLTEPNPKNRNPD